MTGCTLTTTDDEAMVSGMRALQERDQTGSPLAAFIATTSPQWNGMKIMSSSIAALVTAQALGIVQIGSPVDLFKAEVSPPPQIGSS